METILRVAAIYIFIMVALRLIGKREFSKLAPFELVTLLLIPEIAAQSLLREDFSITNALIGLSTLFLLVFFTSALTHRSRKLEKIIAGSPTVLVDQGAFVPENMNRERVSPSEVFGEMHQAGLHRLDQVRWAILESDGKISFIPADSSRPVIRDESQESV